VREFIFVFIIAAMVTYLTTPVARLLAFRVRAFTAVRDRDVHDTVIPRLGGVAMYLGFGAALLVASVLPRSREMFATGELWGVLAGATIVCVLGAIDDIRDLDWLVKLAGQMVAAGIMARMGVQLFALPLGESVVLPAPVLVGITIFCVILATNAVNFVDGLDGLATGIVLIASVSFFAYAYLISRSYDPPNVFTSCGVHLRGAGRLLPGLPPTQPAPEARIFMGDSGALLLGLLSGRCDDLQSLAPSRGADVSASPLMATVLAAHRAGLDHAACRSSTCCSRWCGGPGAARSRGSPTPSTCTTGCCEWGHGHLRAVLILWLWTACAAVGSVGFVFLEPVYAVGLLGALVASAFALTVWRRAAES
jgi:UDP-GlcNAc:undecaprenyl-phosphate GlcNAc-1-phosphate transferase